MHRAVVVENVQAGTDAFRLRLHAPVLARSFRPGQFVNVRVSEAGSWDPLLRRPFGIMRSSGRGRREPGEEIDLLGLVVGRGTRRMSRFHAGEEVDLVGPLGNSFLDEPLGLRDAQRVIVVAGGVGVAPFFALVDWLVEEGRGEEIDFLFGARTAGALCARQQVEELPVRVALSTDDGSVGHRGLVTELLAEVLPEAPADDTLVIACGPDVMMRATAGVARSHGARCVVSLENEMACGTGACYGCVVPLPGADGQIARYARSCQEGPIFPAATLGW